MASADDTPLSFPGPSSRVLIMLLLVITIGTSKTADAESSSAAMTTFGLIGTWSQDCAKERYLKLDLDKNRIESNERFTFSTPTFGPPKFEEGDGSSSILS